MIGVVGRPRISGTSSFVDLISYMRDRDKESIGAEGSVNIDVEKYPAEEMEAVADQNKKCKNPLLHVILSWRETEYPTSEQAHQAVMLTLKEMGLEDCQAVWAVHKDTQNTHLHIAVNRVHPETHKAIDAADGWTIKGVHRAARKVELAQGWEIQQDGIYQVSAEGKLEQKHKDPAKGKYSKSALDMEAHTGEKSAERIAKETAAPIIRAATSWGDLHRGLAEKGIEFVPKGSGVVLKVGDDYVKLSKAGRDITLHKLQDKLGAFEVKRDNVSVAEREPECVEKIEQRGLKDDWKRYKGEQFNKGFKGWLGTNLTPLPAVIYRYQNDCVAYGITEVLTVEKMDMRGFFADTSARKNCVTYINKDDKNVTFLDYGNKICMGKKYTDESILAMLQLANNKWKVVDVRGSKDYIEACVRVASEHNLRIDNCNINTEKKEQLEPAQNEHKTQRQQQTTKRGVSDPNAAYHAHAKDITARMSLDDYSKIDALIGIRMRVTGHTPTQISAAIEANAPALLRQSMSQQEFDAKCQSRDWHRYAWEITDNFVFGARGYKQLQEAERYAPYYYKVEGRDYASEKAEQRTVTVNRTRTRGIDMGR